MKARSWLPEGDSKASLLARLAGAAEEFLQSLSKGQRRLLPYFWPFWARPKQLAPPDVDHTIPNCPPWRYWLILAGRMWGKSRTAAEWIRARVESGKARRILLAAPNYQDVEKVMIPAIQRAFPDSRRPRYTRSNLELKFWPYTYDAPVAEIRTSEKPDGFRGREWDCGWIDEFASFDNMEDCWMWLLPAMRAIPPKGGVPQLIITTTPRNKKILHDLLEDPRTVLTQGESAENERNVAEGVLDAVRHIYGGTDLADQELGGKLLGNEPGALFHRKWFIDNRETRPDKFIRKIIAVDTSGSGKDGACECGIMLFGVSERLVTENPTMEMRRTMGPDGRITVQNLPAPGQLVRFPYLLGDYSLRATPEEWAKVMYEVYLREGVHEIVYEANFGGELIQTMFRQMKLQARFRPIPARGSKAQRAMPVSALVQGGKVKFVGEFPRLEMQCCTWVPGDSTSPDRMDAFVHGVTELVPAVQVARGHVALPGFR